MKFGIMTFAVVGGLAALVSTPAASTNTNSQATRTWVSANGSDSDTCSRNAPCKTFAGAIGKTAAGGEINCVDPAGYGSVTITKSITIDCRGTYGGILATGTYGIIINGADIHVVLRNLVINGTVFASATSTRGVTILAAAKVIIEDSAIFGFSAGNGAGQGISDQRTTANSMLVVRNTSIHSNGGPGIVVNAAPNSGTVLDNVSSTQNAYGLAVGNGNNVSATRSIFSNNSVAGVQTDTSGKFLGDNVTITHNAVGVRSNGSVMLSNSTIGFNSTGVTLFGTGTVTSYGNNRVAGNVVPGPALTAAGALSTEFGQQ